MKAMVVERFGEAIVFRGSSAKRSERGLEGCAELGGTGKDGSRYLTATPLSLLRL